MVMVATFEPRKIGEGFSRLTESIDQARECLERGKVENGEARRRQPDLDLLHAAHFVVPGACRDDGGLWQTSGRGATRRDPAPVLGHRGDVSHIGAQGRVPTMSTQN